MRVFRNAEEVSKFRCTEFKKGYYKTILDPDRTTRLRRGLELGSFTQIGERSYSYADDGHGSTFVLRGNNNSILAMLIIHRTEEFCTLEEINSAFLNSPDQLQELMDDVLNADNVLLSQKIFSVETLDIWKNLGNKYTLEILNTETKCIEDLPLKETLAWIEDPDFFHHNYQLSLRK